MLKDYMMTTVFTILVSNSTVSKTSTEKTSWVCKGEQIPVSGDLELIESFTQFLDPSDSKHSKAIVVDISVLNLSSHSLASGYNPYALATQNNLTGADFHTLATDAARTLHNVGVILATSQTTNTRIHTGEAYLLGQTAIPPIFIVSVKSLSQGLPVESSHMYLKFKGTRSGNF